MHAAALVAFGDVRKEVRGLDREFLEDLHDTSSYRFFGCHWRNALASLVECHGTRLITQPVIPAKSAQRTRAGIQA